MYFFGIPILIGEIKRMVVLIVSFICLAGALFTTQLEETKGKFEFDPEYIMRDTRGELSEDKTVTAQPIPLKSDLVQNSIPSKNKISKTTDSTGNSSSVNKNLLDAYML